MNSYIQSLRKIIGPRKIIHPAARIVIENSLGEILLIHRKDDDQWGLIAGGLENNEDIKSCIIREVKEETGLTIKKLTGIGISSDPEIEFSEYPNGDQIQYLTTVFYSNVWEGRLLVETQETREARFFSKNTLPDLTPKETLSISWVEKFKRDGNFVIE